MDNLRYQTLEVQFRGTICFIKFNRPEAKNTIDAVMVDEIDQVLAICEEKSTVVVFEGRPDIFCLGADLDSIVSNFEQIPMSDKIPDKLYSIWLKLATGPYVSLAHVEGRVNAGGLGFVAACDVVLAKNSAQFGLSELLFGLFPACVLPFLIRKVGYQKSHYLTLMTKSFSVEVAQHYGLVDAYAADSDSLLKTHLRRLEKLPKEGIRRYKKYRKDLDNFLSEVQGYAVSSNQAIFSDPKILSVIADYIQNEKLPWENNLGSTS